MSNCQYPAWGKNFCSTFPAPTPPTTHTHTHSVARYMPFISFVDIVVITVCCSPYSKTTRRSAATPHTVWRVGRGAWERAWPHLTSFTPSPVEVGPNSVPGSWAMMGHVHTAAWHRLAAKPKLKVQSCCHAPVLPIPTAMSSGRQGLTQARQRNHSHSNCIWAAVTQVSCGGCRVNDRVNGCRQHTNFNLRSAVDTRTQQDSSRRAARFWTPRLP